MKNKLSRILGVALLGALVASVAAAGGPLYTFDPENRIPYAWNLETWGGTIPVYTDLGGFGRLSNSRADELVAAGLAEWNNVETSSFVAQVVGDFSLIGLGDITAFNAQDVIGVFNGGGIHVIYDDDGNIMRNFFGVSPSVLGISEIEAAIDGTSEIIEAWTVLNGSAVRSNDPNGDAFFGVFTHELGHTVNLSHTQMNGAVYNRNDPNRPYGCDTITPWSTARPAADQIETMYPFINVAPGGTGAGMGTVEKIDDTAALSDLYPAPGYPENRGTIRGKILFGLHKPTEITGVNVIARNIADPYGDASSYLSGQISKGFAGPDGEFVFNGLTPGAEYVLYVDNVRDGAFAVPRLITLPGPEEYYNGAGESGDGETDNRCVWTGITVQAGSPVIADVTFNKVKGSPDFIPLAPSYFPSDMTYNGDVVVGVVGSTGVFKWTTDDPLGSIPPVIEGSDRTGWAGISRDGTRIAGNTIAPDGNSVPGVYENGSWTPLAPIEGATPVSGTYGSTYGISDDGNYVVGLGYLGSGSGNYRAFYGNESTGMIALPQLPDGRGARANGVNADGSVIVGWNDSQIGSRRGTAWDNGAPFLISGDPAVFVGEAQAATPDGSIIVGNSPTPTDRGAWKWSASTGVQSLGAPPDPFSRLAGAAGVCDSGEVVVGYYQTFRDRFPTLWTEELGTVDMTQFLEAQGTYLQDMTPATVTAISGDCRTMGAWAFTQFGQFGYLIKTPKVVMCHASPGRLDKTTTIDVSFPGGLADHIAHGDTFGMCQHGGL